MRFKERDCPLCESSMSSTWRRGSYLYAREFQDLGTFPAPIVIQCVACDFVYLNPIMTDEEYNKFYDNDEQRKFAASVTKETEEQYQCKISRDDKRRAELVNNHTSASNLLDIGTGFSNFVGLIDGAIGIDVSESRARDAQRRGLDVRLCDIFDWEEKMKNATLFHVLEHIPDPKPFLRRIYDVLDDNGRLVVEVPNLNDALVGIKRYQDFYFQNAHCSYFTPKTLEGLLKNEGFVVKKEIKLQRYSLDNHLHWLLKGKPGKIKALSFLNPVYSAMLKAINRHDTIFFVCSKE